MEIFLITMHVLAAFVLIAVVLLQHGKGADIGATFGAGASQTVFGGRGASNFLSKLTSAAVAVFMVTSITLTYFSNPNAVPGMFDDAPVTTPIPATPEVEAIEGAQPIEGAAPAPAVEEIPAPGAAVPQAGAPAAEPTPTPVPEGAPAPSGADAAPTPAPETEKPAGS